MPRLLAPAALLTVLALPASASAVVTASQVTSPQATVSRLIDGNLTDSNPANRLVIAGTASASSGDQVDLRCAYRDPDGTINSDSLFGGGEGVPVSAGAFSQDVALFGQGGCRIVATPAGIPPADLTPFSGPRYFSAEQNVFTVGGGPNAATVRDFYVGSTRPTLEADFLSIGHGGAPFDMAPVDDSGDLPYFSQELWYGNAALYATSTKAGETRAQLQVDGIDAFAPDAAAGLFSGAQSLGGLPSITVDSVDVNPATGDVTHVSTEPFVTCPTTGGANVTAGAANLTNCSSLRPSGVAVRRTVVLRVATSSVETKDRWVSTDGSAHEIDALYDQRQREMAPAQNGYRFPWLDGSAFKPRTAGEEIAPPPGRVSSIFAKTKTDAPDGDARYTQGSLTLSTRPDVIRFTGSSRFELGYRRTVPASGALAIDQRFTVGTQRSVVERLADEMQSRANGGLGVAITSSTQVSGYDPSYTLSGTTTTEGGVRSLIVNGAPVTPNPDGSWSARMQLSPGANAMSATVTDNAGDSAATAGTVSFTPGPAQSALLNSAVRKGILRVTVRCQTLPGTTCAGRLKLTARVTRVIRTRRGKRRSTKTITLATRSFKLAAGDRAVPTARLSRTVRKLVRKYRVKRATLTLTQTVGGRTKTTRSSVSVRL